jgi:hypothetical protein
MNSSEGMYENASIEHAASGLPPTNCPPSKRPFPSQRNGEDSLYEGFIRVAPGVVFDCFACTKLLHS